MTGYRQEAIESAPTTPGAEDQDSSDGHGGPMSLPYWVEASHNIYKVTRKIEVFYGMIF